MSESQDTSIVENRAEDRDDGGNGNEEEESEQETESKLADLSGQGLTTLPNGLFNRIDVVQLNLSSNNLKNLPIDLVRLRCLRFLDLSHNALRCTSVNDSTTLPMQMGASLVCLEEIVLSECNLTFIPAAVWQVSSLVRLDISRNKLSSLPSDIGGLEKLKLLNAQQSGLKSLPAEIVCCENVERLLLFGNPIETLPDTMRELVHLTQLSLNTAHFCSDIDEHVEGLLANGKIQSEHIPPVFLQIPNLRIMNLEKCKLNTLPETLNEGLNELSIAKNYFNHLPLAITLLSKLTTLDISHNFINDFPEEFAQLITLERLVARANRLEIISPSISKLGALKLLDLGDNQIRCIPDHLTQRIDLQTLILDRNCINCLPDSICDMIGLETLDLTANQISALPLSLFKLSNIISAHVFNGLFKAGLWLHKNPITSPPPSVWKCTQPQKLWTYLQASPFK